jgi:pimeloyl-ACP methyl ester carboxylesterase
MWLLVAWAGPAWAQSLEEAPVGGGLVLPYYSSGLRAAPDILVAVQGYVRDANRTFDAAAKAAADAGHSGDTLIVAPIFEVSDKSGEKCSFPGVPKAAPGDALWHCGDWSDGGPARNGAVTSFRAMDRLIDSLLAQDKAARVVTVAGFSAGGQFVQRYAAFAAVPAGVKVKFVVADPSSFLYFDSFRPAAGAAACPGYNDWKFGLGGLPNYLGRNAAAARAAYAAADVSYLEGALDDSAGPGTSYKLLSKDCGAALQGPFRLQRGQAYAGYDAKFLAHGAHKLTVVPGCGHSVVCVFESHAARAVLFGD